tara:strand:- start:410 stop:655 length:246 start_codon:yes stop_codon:yes gene_type:complete
MEKVINYITGFLQGLVCIMMAIIPVTILWTLLTGGFVFNIDFIGNSMGVLEALGEEGFVGLVALIFITYFFMCCNNGKCKF